MFVNGLKVASCLEHFKYELHGMMIEMVNLMGTIIRDCKALIYISGVPKFKAEDRIMFRACRIRDCKEFNPLVDCF